MSGKKILKERGVSASAFEQSVAQALFDLEATNSELKGDLRDLYICSASEIDVTSSQKAVIIQVPYRLKKGCGGWCGECPNGVYRLPGAPCGGYDGRAACGAAVGGPVGAPTGAGGLSSGDKTEA